jgi:hypothetical protein
MVSPLAEIKAAMPSASCDTVSHHLSISSVHRLAVSITSGLPVIRPEQQMLRRSWRQSSRRLAGPGKNPGKYPSTSCSWWLAFDEFVIYAALV